MRIEFDSLTDLDNFFQWIAKRGAPVMVQLEERKVGCVPELGTGHGADLPKLTDAPQLQASVTAELPHADQHDVPAPAEQKRKRRTKAEMEAARAEESGETVAANAAAEQPDGFVTISAAPVESQSIADAGNPFAQPTLPEGQESAGAPAASVPAETKPAAPEPASDIGDLQGFVAARLAERPTLENIEHLNMARSFIAKHGMPKYNETFALAGLSANIMAFSPADCARHAAVLDFLATE